MVGKDLYLNPHTKSLHSKHDHLLQPQKKSSITSLKLNVIHLKIILPGNFGETNNVPVPFVKSLVPFVNLWKCNHKKMSCSQISWPQKTPRTPGKAATMMVRMVLLMMATSAWDKLLSTGAGFLPSTVSYSYDMQMFIVGPKRRFKLLNLNIVVSFRSPKYEKYHDVSSVHGWSVVTLNIVTSPIVYGFEKNNTLILVFNLMNESKG